MIQNSVRPLEKGSESEVSCVPILENACDRVQMTRCTVKAGCTWVPEVYPGPQVTQMFLFLTGSGYVTTDSFAAQITQPALFVPDFDKERITIHVVAQDMECIRIVSQMNREDCAQLQKSHMIFPRFRLFSQAWEHTMHSIDSADSNTRAFVLIENRKLGANNMGLLRSGYHEAAKVSEDMLPTYDQYIIGLAGANCTLHMDGEESAIKEGSVAFIPKGATFSFECNAGGMIHHIWYSLNRAYDE